MSNPQLTSLTIEYLRGSVTPFKLTFEKGKKLTIVYGENGTGKTTISDAFDLLGNGNVGSLDTRGIGPTRKYWPTVGKKAADVKVTLETTAGNCTVSLSTSEAMVSGPEFQPEVAVLRRSQILGLIEAKPADRYKEISRFVDVSGVETSENTLRQVIKDKEREFDNASIRVSENRSTIERIAEQSGQSSSGAIGWAGQQLKKDLKDLDRRKTEIDHLISLWASLAKHPQQIDERTKQVNAAENALKTAQIELGKLQASMATDYLEVIDILKAAQFHFQKHPNPTVCPLCESTEKAGGLAEEVNKRIQSQGLYSKLDSAQKLETSSRAALEQMRERLSDAKKAATNDASELETFCKDGELPAGVTGPNFPVPPDVAKWTSWIATHQDKREQWTRLSDACVAEKTLMNTLKTSQDALQNNEKQAKTLEKILPRLRNALKLVEGARKKFTDEILGAMSTRVGELYEAIHPGEGLSKIVLALDAAKRASLEISAEFAGKTDSPPQAYFSDSHLDTLGLCVFLALAERENPENKVLVLDDVLGSVDEPHVDRVIEMVYEVVTKFRHCIATTHYGPWRHKFRWGWLKNGQCQFVELTRWSMEKGISLVRGIPETERLRLLLAESSPDLQSICAKSGVILEAVLDFLTQLYECTVPRRAGGVYTLGDLLPAVDGKLKKVLRVEHRQKDGSYTAKELEPHITELARIAQVRNVSGAHFNALSFELLDSDCLVFGTQVLALADALIDHETGWPKNDKSGSYWATTGETRRLHPLKRPN